MTMTLAKTRGRRWTVALEWKAADLWVGAFWDRRGPLLNVWFCLVPCLPIHVQMLRPATNPEPETKETSHD
jgi:hypothetical protein